jgi:hypothetical protein
MSGAFAQPADGNEKGAPIGSAFSSDSDPLAASGEDQWITAPTRPHRTELIQGAGSSRERSNE